MKRSPFNNPVLFSELKIKMRGWKSIACITVYLALMLFIAFLFFKMQESSLYSSYITNRQQTAQESYSLLAVIQFILILILTPAQTAGVISGEREKQTLDLLLCTRISSLGIITGKLLSSMSFILLLIISSVPLFSLVFLFGGIEVVDIATLFLFYLVTAFAVGSIGIFCSAFFRKTVTATVASYVIVFALGILTLLTGIYMMQLHYTPYASSSVSQEPYVPFVFYLNPAVGLADLFARQLGGGSGFLPYFMGTRYATVPGQAGSSAFFEQWSFWIKNCVVMLSVAGGLILLSAWKINPLKNVRVRRKHNLAK